MYEVKGWETFSQLVDVDTQRILRRECIDIRDNWQKYSSWQGVSCASKYSYELRKFYKSYLVSLARKLLEKPDIYYFNDQVVVKKPFDRMQFVPHYDNYYGPNADGKIHTVNLLVCLDPITSNTGGFWLQNQDDKKWVSIQPKPGDVVAINGNTYHRSGENKGTGHRAMYACVYTAEPINLKGFYNSPVVGT